MRTAQIGPGLRLVLRPPSGLKTDVENDIFWYEQVCDEFRHREHNNDP